MKTAPASPCSTLSIAFLLMLSFFTGGCALMKVREDVKTLQSSIVLVGVVSTSDSFSELPVVVAAYSALDQTRTIAHYTTLHEPGSYELMVPKGSHNIIAFGDRNKNLIYDPGEPAGQLLHAEQLSAPTAGVAGHLDIVLLDKHDQKVDFPIGSGMPPKEFTQYHSTCPGALADLDQYVFSQEYGNQGLWTSLDFFREIGGNVYFLEEYDPVKIPILFIHGAAGSPQDWQSFFEQIDRSKYQPWFFYYPSGSSIDSMSYLLFWKLQNLQIQYQFSELYLTAHSMGGLVARSFLVNYGHLFPSITSFISISTPWGGEELAEMGVKYSPGVVPSWRDMQPGSDFIESTLSKELPPAVDYYLFFGHKGDRNILRPNNDKAVTLTSQLDPRSQRDAKMIYGFNEDHISILSSQQVLTLYNTILSDITMNSGALGKEPGNRLLIDFTFNLPEELPKPIVGLYLSPLDEKGSETWIYLSPEDTGREHGPFPPGDYDVSILAPAFVPEPAKIPVTICEGSVPGIQVSLNPAGYIRGYVAKNDQPNMQAGKELKLDNTVEIESITVKGKGINRTVVPLQGKRSQAELFPEHYLSESDYSAEGAFFFFGLPEGKYELTVHALGHEPYSTTCDVKPGHYQNIIVAELVEAGNGP